MFRFTITLVEKGYCSYYHHTYVFDKDVSKIGKEQALYILEKSIKLLHPNGEIIQEVVTKLN